MLNVIKEVSTKVVLSLGLIFSLSVPALYAQDSTTGQGNKATAEAGTSASAAGASAGAEGDVAKGEVVFNGNCKQCHAFNEVVVGPALAGVLERWPNEAALHQFIKYPQKTIDGGNVYAKGLYDKYKQYMPNHDFLAETDIDAVIAYIKKGGAIPATASVQPGSVIQGNSGQDASAQAGGGSGGEAPAYINVILGILMLVLVLVLVVLLLMVSILNKAVNNNPNVTPEEKEFLEQKTDVTKFLRSGAFMATVILTGFLWIGKVGYDKVYAIGIQQGYAPKQPIAFSHKLHAGMYEIDCNYCHTGVTKGKQATIPSVNICMNCHNAIKTESPQIKKIWNAVNTGKPIEWIRIHNLPDLAYFNHAQHVKVGNIQCQTCHGDIQNMEVVKQHSTLTMGWCINCHRQTAVNAKGNAYYDKLLYLHKQTKKGEMHVADIGGLECSKCHY